MMENVWSIRDSIGMHSQVERAEIIEAEVVDGRCASPSGNSRLRFMRPAALLFAAVFLTSMLGGFVGGGAIYAAIGAIDSLASHLDGRVADGEPHHSIPTSVPAESSVVAADGLRVRCAGSYVKPGEGKGGEPMVMVALEVQNTGAKTVLRKSQFSAISADGRSVGPVDQTISREEGGFFQFTSIAAEPGERFLICVAFYQVSEPVQIVYEPHMPGSAAGAPCVTLDIGGAQESILA